MYTSIDNYHIFSVENIEMKNSKAYVYYLYASLTPKKMGHLEHAPRRIAGGITRIG